MASVTIDVPESEQASGVVTILDVTVVEESPTDGMLRVFRGADCIAEYPAGRYLAWRLDDEPESGDATDEDV